MTVEVVRTYLEMAEPSQLVPSDCPDKGARVERVPECPPSFYRYLYAEVGKAHYWVDRLGWTDDEIRRHLDRPDVSIFLLTVASAPAGYFELCRHGDGSVEVAYFGLLPEFLRRGLGKYLLTVAVREAWAQGPRRVWLHTCSLDDPAALPNYLHRGFRPFRSETYTAHLPPEKASATRP